MIPKYWSDFVESHQLTGKSFELAENEDKSGIGAALTILTVEQSLDESTNFWPGIGVAADGYLPVAWCDTGSGDYYYINSNDGPNGALYRVYHDSVNENGYDPEMAIDIVLSNYELLLEHAA
jgi:hypothetical protein